MNAIQKMLPKALIIGAGRFRGNGNAPNISAINRMIAIKRSNQKLANKIPSTVFSNIPPGIVKFVRIFARTTTIRKQMIPIIRDTNTQPNDLFRYQPIVLPQKVCTGFAGRIKESS